MTIFWHEWRSNWRSFLIWSLSLGLFVLTIVLIFPEMQKSMGEMDELFANMGGFTAAFGLQHLSMSDPLGYYALENGTVLAIGGGFFAAFLGTGMLAKEEGRHSTEFLLTLPLSRLQVALEKLLAQVTQIIALNLICYGMGFGSLLLISTEFDYRNLFLLHLALTVLMLQVGLFCFGLSAFMRESSLGLGIGLTLALYLLNMLINLQPDWSGLRFLTPFAFSEPSRILPEGSLEWPIAVSTGLISSFLLGVGLAYYSRKDIAI